MSNVKTSLLITLLLALAIGYSFFCVVSYLNDWNKANSLGEKFLVGYTVLPAGGGLGDKFVEYPLHPPITFTRMPGTTIKFGGWEELREISYVRIVLFINPYCNTTVVISLSRNKSNMNVTIAELYLEGDKWHTVDKDINITRVYKEPWRVEPHEILALHVFSKEDAPISIYSDTYIWIEMRKAEAPPPPSLLMYFTNYLPQFSSGVSMILASKIPIEPIIARIKSIFKRKGKVID
jgi:hypothetical protein